MGKRPLGSVGRAEWRLQQSLGWGRLPHSVCFEDCFEAPPNKTFTHLFKLLPKP